MVCLFVLPVMAKISTEVCTLFVNSLYLLTKCEATKRGTDLKLAFNYIVGYLITLWIIEGYWSFLCLFTTFYVNDWPLATMSNRSCCQGTQISKFVWLKLFPLFLWVTFTCRKVVLFYPKVSLMLKARMLDELAFDWTTYLHIWDERNFRLHI